MTQTKINLDAIWTDEVEITALLIKTFKTVVPPIYVLYTKREGLKEVKVGNGNDYYCISQISGTFMGEQKERWALALLQLTDNNLVTYKYMHPITQEVVNNLSEFDVSTLPQLN